MTLDLSALNVATGANFIESTSSSGAPLEISLALIDEDPDQPRAEFSTEALSELAASIKLKGVKSPVSVRKSPNFPGRWILKYGSRRFRASLNAGKTTIPAFVDEAHDDYDQVVENLQRDDLKPIELALFVKKRIDAGDKKKDIAKKLGKSADFVTIHLALIDMPPEIENAYATGRCTSPRTIHDLRALHKDFPVDVDEWLKNHVDDIERRDIEKLKQDLRHDQDVPAQEITLAPAQSREPEAGQDSSEIEEEEVSEPSPEDRHNPPRSNEIKSPHVHVTYKRRAAVLLIRRRPTTEGLAFIRYEDGSEEEVDAGLLKINRITDD